ncbi:hypothetical protein ACFOU2_09825 [Bacillus songklensis]|uniref:PDZ domain-containing protein n=1 Tax=Bacillus songklensis TaxID=1069116 RepID=A0ABV8B0H5_9BACI
MSIENQMVEKNGYGIQDPQEEDRHEGIDACGDEILKGDYILEINGEVILESNAIDYLVDVLSAIRKVAGEE